MEDIDWRRNLIDLRQTVGVRGGQWIINTPKSGKLRTIDIPAAVTARLRELRSIRQAEAAVTGREPPPWVFPAATDPTKPMNDAWPRDRLWRPLREKAEVRHIRLHDARHTYASLMLRRNVPLPYVSRQPGHSSIQITVDLYGHFQPGADRHHAGPRHRAPGSSTGLFAGKELAADAVRDASPRRDGPYVSLNCAALPADRG